MSRRDARGGRRSPIESVESVESAGLLAELDRLYQDADSAFRDWSCPSSTECCRFGITGREPYVTSIELLALRRAIASLGGPKAWKRAAPMPDGRASSGEASRASGQPRRTLPIARDERACPMLTAAGRCAVYSARPLGCRTFYCERASSGAAVKHKAINALVRLMKDLASRHAPEGDLGRPLTRALADLLGRDRPR